MNTAIIISKDDLKETLAEISREITQTVIIQLRAETQPARELMTLAQTAEYLQCSVQSVKNWSDRADDKNPLPSCNAGAAPRFYKSEVDAWLVRERVIRQKRKESLD